MLILLNISVYAQPTHTCKRSHDCGVCCVLLDVWCSFILSTERSIVASHRTMFDRIEVGRCHPFHISPPLCCGGRYFCTRRHMSVCYVWGRDGTGWDGLRWNGLVWAAVSVAVFTVEYVCRVWTITESGKKHYQHGLWGRLRYAISLQALIDFVSIATFYLCARSRSLAHSRLLRPRPRPHGLCCAVVCGVWWVCSGLMINTRLPGLTWIRALRIFRILKVPRALTCLSAPHFLHVPALRCALHGTALHCFTDRGIHQRLSIADWCHHTQSGPSPSLVQRFFTRA
jgi:hypothetical protein